MKALALSLLLCFSISVVAQNEHHHDFDPHEKVGTVHFPISCNPAVAKQFERGVALLHSFWYEQARKQFVNIESADPKCAMAYWGDAMTYWHQLWDPPTPDDLQRGAELVQKGLALRATSRERAYLEALSQFYGDHQHADHTARAKAYSAAMEKLYASYPDDDEAGAFYALSLLASATPGDKTFSDRKKAVALLNVLYVRNPEHPGIPHYIIHACDSPQMAHLALNAARAYAKIAPASPHALHMPSHIFARLGLWQEDINSNLASAATAEASHATGHELHAMDFLSYAYLQTGQDSQARDIIAKASAIPRLEDMQDTPEILYRFKAELPATYALETRNWKAAEQLQVPAGAPDQSAIVTYWGRTIGAGHLHDAKAAEAALKDYNAALSRIAKTRFGYMIKYLTTDTNEMRAWTAFAEGKNEEGLSLLRHVADEQDAFGKGEVALPAREMLADMLLEIGRPQQALAEYEQSMKIDPNRFNGLYGAAHAAELAKEPEKARQYYAQLLKNCDGVTSDRVELVEAKRFVATTTAVGGE